ncbi:uncharacterized protein NH340_JMT09020 [Sarcoptes scabiei]|nr:uncharacterized protein NH340_JMT09020 [Sarcoptes scabiei]
MNNRNQPMSKALKIPDSNTKSQLSSNPVNLVKDDQGKEKDSTNPSGILAHFSTDSVKMLAESIGIANLADDAARMIADDVTIRLKCIAQDARKFTVHGRRTTMNVSDIDYALKNKNISPMFGYTTTELTPFKFASGGGRELYFQEEKEIDLYDAIGWPLSGKIPQDISLKCHWLCIEGVQPAIPENPPPLPKDCLRIAGVDPLQMLRQNQNDNDPNNKFIAQKPKKRVEVVKVKQYATHELSMEQQLYYKEITEACVGSDESRRSEALQSLTYDSGLYQMLPRLCIFISEGVKINVVQNNLALLIYLMRMIKALMDNHNLYLEKYLHVLMPTVLTCIVSKQLCLRPEQDNHWALRDFGSRLLAQICRNFNTNTNNIQIRVTQLLNQVLEKERLPLASLYGVLACLSELGAEVQRAFILKRLKMIGERIRSNIEGLTPSSIDKNAAGHIESLIMKYLPNTIKNHRQPPDIFEEYRNDYGYFGPQLFNAVMNLRSKENAGSQVSNRINLSGNQAIGQQVASFRRITNLSNTNVIQPQAKFAIISGSSGPSLLSSSSSTSLSPSTTPGSGNLKMLRITPSTIGSNVSSVSGQGLMAPPPPSNNSTILASHATNNNSVVGSTISNISNNVQNRSQF